MGKVIQCLHMRKTTPQLQKWLTWGWECSSTVQRLSSIREALGSTSPRTPQQKILIIFSSNQLLLCYWWHPPSHLVMFLFSASWKNRFLKCLIAEFPLLLTISPSRDISHLPNSSLEVSQAQPYMKFLQCPLTEIISRFLGDSPLLYKLTPVAISWLWT
jgi:hypothetical protein